MEFCKSTASIWQLVGYALFILKIVIPIILIILGIIDFSKAAISSDDKMIKDAAISFLKRAIAAVAIFFIPTIIDVCFNLIAGVSESLKDDLGNCITCITNPGGKKCDTSNSKGIFD